MKIRSNRWHAMQSEDVLRAFSTNRYKGLTSREATARRLKKGNSVLWSQDLRDRYPSLLHQVCDYTTVLFVLTVLLAALFSRGTESLSIAVLLVISVGLRTLVILSTRKIYRHNMKYTCPRCRVMRDGKCLYLFADQIVDGDILLLSSGDTVPADIRLIAGELIVSEAYLDGCRRQIQKNADDIVPEKASWSERSNTVYAASTVLSGDSVGVAVATGERTLAYAQKGHILPPKEEKSYMVQRAAELSRTVSLIMMIFCGIYLIVGVLAKNNPVPLDQLFLSAVSLIVSSSSELLCTVVWGMLAETMQRLSADGLCIIKSATAVENLAVAEWVVVGGEHLLRTGELFIHSWCGADLRFHEYTQDTNLSQDILRVCGSIERCFPKSGSLTAKSASENPSAFQNILAALQQRGVWPDTGEIRVCMESVICNGMVTSLVAEENTLFAYVSGSIDDVIGCCSKVMTESGPRAITSEEIAAARTHSRFCKTHGIKTIAAAMRVSPLNHLDRPASVQNSMIFLGCVSVSDPVDPEVRELVTRCRDGGVRVAFLCEETQSAEHIARASGIICERDRAQICDIRNVGEWMTRADGANLLIHTLPGKTVDLIREMQKHSRNVVYLGDRLADLSITGICPVIFAEETRKRPVDTVSRRADGIIPRVEAAGKRQSTSRMRDALHALAVCRGAIVKIRWSVLYLLLAQALRCVLALFALCTGMPLLTASQALLLGCVIDFLAVLAMAFRRSESRILSVRRERITLPKWRTGLLASLGIGILAGLCLSLSQLTVSRVLALFDPAVLDALRLIAALSITAAVMHLCADRTRINMGRPRLSGAYIAYLATVAGLVGILVYTCAAVHHVTDWRVWLIFAIPAVITGIMLKIYKNAQEN